jgi:hypothetical protein
LAGASLLDLGTTVQHWRWRPRGGWKPTFLSSREHREEVP